MNETYEFSFERSQLMKVIGGLLSLVLLVFCAGFLVGIALQVRQPAPALVAQAPQPQPAPVAAALAAPAIVAPPEEPVADEDRPAVDASDDVATVDPDPPAVEAEAKLAASDPGKFAVQFGAFLQSKNAGILAKRLTAKGYLSDVVEREDSHGRTWYLVRYGAFTNRTEATAAAVELKTRESLDAVVRPSNSM
jgi:cell division septation protein DedD